MKKVSLLFICVAVLSTSALASGVGSPFGTMTTARVTGMGRADFGTGVGIADATSVFATLNYGMSREVDGRLKLGLYDAGHDVNLALGADLKWQMWDMSQGRREPFDMSFGGLFEFVDAGYASAFEFGGFALGSYPFALSNASTLSPYARLNVRLETINPDDSRLDNKTDLRFGLNGGVAWQATSVISLLGEFQVDGNDGIFLGANFNIQ